MKVLQINSVYKAKSTGRTCYEVEKALLEAGDECITACQFGFEMNNPHVYRINSFIEYYLHNILGRLTGLCGYGSIFATWRFIRFMKRYDPDIIHLRNLHAFYINLPVLFNYLKQSGKPVILNIHDCWIFTGKCPHYTANNCEKWKNECFECPKQVIHQYPQSIFFDFSRKMFRDKKRWLTSLNRLHVVGVSRWTAAQARLSFLSGKKIDYIYNWIDLENFRPYKENVLKQYGLDRERFTVVFAGVGWGQDSPKSYDLACLLDACKNENIQFVIIGQSDFVSTEYVKYIGYVADVSILAKLYSSCDVYVHLSVEDTFGKVIAEAMACGIPAIVYNSTAIPELIDSNTGIVVEPHDIAGIKDAILTMRENGKAKYSEACRKRVENLFNYRDNVRELIELYREEMNP